GEHDDGHGDAARPELPAHAHAVDVGEHPVQDDDVVGDALELGERGFPIDGDVRDVALLFERTLQEPTEPLAIFYDQDLHRRFLSLARPATRREPSCRTNHSRAGVKITTPAERSEAVSAAGTSVQ